MFLQPRSQKALYELIALAGEGFTIFGETHLFDDAILEDVFQLVVMIRTLLPDMGRPTNSWSAQINTDSAGVTGAN